MKATYDANPRPTEGESHGNTLEPAIPFSRREFEIYATHTNEMIQQKWLAHLREHELMDIARNKAEQEVNKRMEYLNNLRSEFDIQRGNFVTRETQEELRNLLVVKMESARSGLDGRIDAQMVTLLTRIDNNEKNIGELNKTLTTLATRVTVAGTVLVGMFTALMAIANLLWKPH